MKIMIITAIVLVLEVSCLLSPWGTTPLYAQSNYQGEERSVASTARSINRGLLNIVFCFTELPKNCESEFKANREGMAGKFLAIPEGLVKGLHATGSRLFFGLVEVSVWHYAPEEPIQEPPYPPYVNEVVIQLEESSR